MLTAHMFSVSRMHVVQCNTIAFVNMCKYYSNSMGDYYREVVQYVAWISPPDLHILAGLSNSSKIAARASAVVGVAVAKT